MTRYGCGVGGLNRHGKEKVCDEEVRRTMFTAAGDLRPRLTPLCGLVPRQVMRADSYVLGSTVFSLEISGWDAFDISPLTDIFTAYLRSA